MKRVYNYAETINGPAICLGTNMRGKILCARKFIDGKMYDLFETPIVRLLKTKVSVNVLWPDLPEPNKEWQDKMDKKTTKAMAETARQAKGLMKADWIKKRAIENRQGEEKLKQSIVREVCEFLSVGEQTLHNLLAQ